MVVENTQLIGFKMPWDKSFITNCWNQEIENMKSWA